jgi:hypothetical protein
MRNRSSDESRLIQFQHKVVNGDVSVLDLYMQKIKLLVISLTLRLENKTVVHYNG